MALSPKETILAEAIDTMLRHNAELGLSIHSDSMADQSHSVQFQHEYIHEMFQLAVTDLVHHDGVCSAFNKVHSYKYLDDPTFNEALESELKSQGIPADERAKAHEVVGKIIEDLMKESKSKAWAERDAGFNPELDAIKDISQPEQPE